jgi:hypothetical protein
VGCEVGLVGWVLGCEDGCIVGWLVGLLDEGTDVGA